MQAGSQGFESPCLQGMGSARVSGVGFGVSPKRSLKVREPGTASPAPETGALPGKNPCGGRRSVGAQNFGTRRRVSLQVQSKKEMPDRASLAIRHLVDVQLSEQRLNCALPSFSLSFEALSRSKVLTACPMDDQLIHPKGLAVDLCLRQSRNSKVESRKLFLL